MSDSGDDHPDLPPLMLLWSVKYEALELISFQKKRRKQFKGTRAELLNNMCFVAMAAINPPEVQVL